MTLKERFDEILADGCLEDQPGALCEMIEPWGWEKVLEQAVDMLENPARRDDWPAVTAFLFRADCHRQLLPMGWAYLVAVLTRCEQMNDEVDRRLVWSIAYRLKGVGDGSDWFPLADEEVMAERMKLARTGKYAWRRETLFLGPLAVAGIRRLVDPLMPSPQAYELDPGVRSNPELSEVAALVDSCLAMYPAADRGHYDRLNHELRQRFSTLLASRDWRLVDAAGNETAAQCPFFFSEDRVSCFPVLPPGSSEDDPRWLRLWLRYHSFRWTCAERFGVPYGRMTSGWTKEKSRNVLSAENVERVRRALSRPGNVVFGRHYFYRGGCGASDFIFADFEAYETVVEASRPGDHFLGFSLADVRHLAAATFGDLEGGEVIDPSPEESARLKKLLTGDVELTAIGRKLDAGSGKVSCWMDGFYELDEDELEETFAEWREWDGEIVLFEDERLEEDQHGVYVAPVSLPPGRRRIHAVVDAKRPNDWGRTPLTGAY